MNKDEERLGDRLKAFEDNEAGRRLMPTIPVIFQFSGLEFQKPFDPKLCICMVKACCAVMEKIKSTFGYVQADEASIVLVPPRRWADMPYSGNVQKLLSVATSTFTWSFNNCMELQNNFDVRHLRQWLFDGKVYSVPTHEEAVKFVQYQESRKLGNNVYLRRGEITRKFSKDEIELLPAKHAARVNPDLLVKRFSYGPVKMMPLDQVENLFETLFGGNPNIVSLEEALNYVK